MIYPILLLATILRFWNINQSLWLDEAAQVIESSVPILTFPANMTAIFHPPLFHIIVHYWLFLGNSEVILRILPVIFGIGSIYITYLLAKDLFNKKVGWVAALLLSINPFHIYYSQEFRPYMMVLFWSLAVFYLFEKSLVKGGRWWVFYTLSLTIFFYSTYMAVFVLIAQLIFLILTGSFTKHVKNIAISYFVSGLLFLPWIPTVFEQIKVSSSFSTDLPGWKDAVSTPVYKVIPQTLVKFIIGQINFYPTILYGIVAAFVSGFWGFIILKGCDVKERSWVYIGTLGFFGLIIPALFSVFLQIASPKRLIFILPVIIILLSVGLDKFKGILFKMLLVALIVINISCLLIFNLNPRFQREDWKGAVSFIENQAGDNAIVLFKFASPFISYTYYSKSNLPTMGLTNGSVVTQELLESKLPVALSGKDQVFLFQYIEGFTDTNHLTENYLDSNGFAEYKVYDFNGVGLIREYHKN